MAKSSRSGSGRSAGSRRHHKRTETKAEALSRVRQGVMRPARLVVTRADRSTATVKVIGANGRCEIEGTALVFPNPDVAMAFLDLA